MKASHLLAAVSATALLASAAAAKADALYGDFDILNNVANASGGLVTFTLNPDGTIAAKLTTNGFNILGFGFDSVATNVAESNFSPTAPLNPDGWTDIYGLHNSGFFCLSCGTTETWTIGAPGDYTSVFQVLGGGHATHALFIFGANSTAWAADAVAGVPGGAVPEPAAWALMVIGFGGLGAALRSRRRTALAAI